MELPQDLLPCVACPYDKQSFLSLSCIVEKRELGHTDEIRCRGLMNKTDDEANAADEEQGQKCINDKDTPGITLKSMDIENDQNDDRRADKGGFDDVHEVIDAGISPHPPVKIEHEEDDELKWNDQPDRIFEVRNCFGRDLSFESDKIGQNVGHAEEKKVNAQDDPKVSSFNEISHRIGDSISG